MYTSIIMDGMIWRTFNSKCHSQLITWKLTEIYNGLQDDDDVICGGVI